MDDETSSNDDVMDSTDIAERLGDRLTFQHKGGDGKSLYTTDPHGRASERNHLYRSMRLEEAQNWFKEGWVPSTDGIPWSTNPDYSRTYLKGDSVVQVEVPASDLLRRYRAMGASPKAEGSSGPGDDAETWGTGPFAEVGRHPSKDANRQLLERYNELRSQDPSGAWQEISKKKMSGEAKKTQNTMFTHEFKTALMQNGRIIARRK